MGIVITISRQLGSRGSYMGTEVAQRLGYRYLDREILHRAAADAGYPDERMVEALAEHERSRSFIFKILETLGRMSPVPMLPSATMREGQAYAEVMGSLIDERLIAEQERTAAAEKYAELIRRVIESYAEVGNVVIAGRGGQAILRHRRNALHVRVYGSPEARARALMAAEGISWEEAEGAIQQSDRSRARFLQRQFGVAWDDPSLYHLSINSDAVSVPLGAHLICEAARWTARAQGEAFVPEVAAASDGGVEGRIQAHRDQA